MRVHGPGATRRGLRLLPPRPQFALRFGADASTAAIWPLIVDGLLTTATVELWKVGQGNQAGGRWAAWLAFVFGISLSLCANIGAAPTLSVLSIIVAACPPLALLLAVELLNRALKRHRASTAQGDAVTSVGTTELAVETCLAEVPDEVASSEPTAEQRMWVCPDFG